MANQSSQEHGIEMSKSAPKRLWWQRVRPIGGRGSTASSRRFRRLELECFEPRRLLDTKTLFAVDDNSIFENTDNSNGAGQYLFSGQAGLAAGIRRALIKFDVAGQIPAGSTINSVSLTLHVSKVRPGSGVYAFGVHRINA